MIQTFAPNTAQKTLAYGIGFRSMDGCFEQLDPSGSMFELDPELVVVVGIKYFGPIPNGVASRNCWATQASVGCRVTLTCTTRRDSSSMITKTKIVRKSASYVCKKSHAQISEA